MRGITAQIRPQRDGVPVLREESQVGAVGVVHKERDACGMADLGDLADGEEIAQIVRRCDVHGSRRLRRFT